MKLNKEVFRYHFARGTWISIAWNWLLINVGRAAEGYLTLSVLYQGASLLPGVHTPASLDNTVFIGQQLALDIGGISLAKQSQQTRQTNIKQADLERKVGFLLISLMIANVILSQLRRFQIIPDPVVVVIEVLLLIFRSIMAVVYGYIVYSPTMSEDASVVRTSDIRERLDEYSEQLNARLQEIETSNRLQLQRMFEGMQQFQSLQTGQISQVIERVQDVQLELQTGLQVEVQNLQEYVFEKLQLVEDGLQHSLIEQVTPLADMLQDFATLPAQLTTVTEEFQQVKVTVERQAQIAAQRTVVRSQPAQSARNTVPLQLPTKRVEVAPSSGRFNKTQFVLDCLNEDAGMPSSEIKAKASKLQQSVTDPIISMARKEFKLKNVEDGSGLQVEEKFELENDPITGEFEKIVVNE